MKPSTGQEKSLPKVAGSTEAGESANSLGLRPWREVSDSGPRQLKMPARSVTPMEAEALAPSARLVAVMV